MPNILINVSNTLSASNDYMCDVGLRLIVTNELADILKPHVLALEANVRAAAERDGRALFLTNDDPDPQPGELYFFAADRDTDVNPLDGAFYTSITLTETNDDAVFDASATRPQIDFLANLIREQLALICETLSISTTEAYPFDN